MKIFDILNKNKNTQEKKDPIINDRTINFEIKFDNSKEKYVKIDEGILKISIKNATEIFRQTIKITNELNFNDDGTYNPHTDIDIMVVRIFKSNNERYFYDITSSNSEFNEMNDISCDIFSEFIWNDLNKMPVFSCDILSEFIWNDLNKMPVFKRHSYKLINSQIFDQKIYNSFIGEY